jgi:hypothetical protein
MTQNSLRSRSGCVLQPDIAMWFWLIMLDLNGQILRKEAQNDTKRRL